MDVHQFLLCLSVIIAVNIRGFAPVTFYSNPPVFVWPLGEGIGHQELVTQSWSGTSSSVTYAAGPSVLDYDAMVFQTSNGSYVDLPVPYSSAMAGDYSITWHMYDVTDGVFLHYKSSTPDSTMITGMKLELSSGSVVIELTGGDGNVSTRTESLALNKATWHRVVVEQDYSNEKLKIYVDGSAVTIYFDSWVAGRVTSFPGTLRVGGAQEGDSFFSGRLSCLQFVGVKNPTTASSYDDECTTPNWPPPTSTTQTTTTTPTTTSTTPITTLTTPTTTSTTPTTTSTTPTTTLTTFITIPTTPTLTTTASPSRAMLPASPLVPWIIGSTHFTVTSRNATYQAQGDIIGMSITELLDCAWMCAHMGSCKTFVFKESVQSVCLLGVSAPLLAFDVGSTVYTAV